MLNLHWQKIDFQESLCQKKTEEATLQASLPYLVYNPSTFHLLSFQKYEKNMIWLINQKNDGNMFSQTTNVKQKRTFFCEWRT